MCVLFNDPLSPGNFTAPINFRLGYVPQFIIGTDLDGKNGNDLIAINEGHPGAPGDVYVFFNDGQGNFSLYGRNFLTEPSEVDPFSIGMFSADFDGDDDPDIAVANLKAGKISIMLTSEEIRGDVNNSGQIDIVDVVYLLNFIFKEGPAPFPEKSGDLNCDGTMSISDVIFILKYAFYMTSPSPCCLCDE